MVTSKVESNEPDYMHWSELREILADGLVTIGSHTVSHKSLPSLDESEMQKEIGESKKVLENNLGVPVDFFSYPWGTLRDFNSRCIKAVSQSNYSLACTSVNGVNSNHDKRFKLRRTKIEWGDDLSVFTKILQGALDIWLMIDYCFRFLQRKEEVDFKEANKFMPLETHNR